MSGLSRLGSPESQQGVDGIFPEVCRQPTEGRVITHTPRQTGPRVACATLIGDFADLTPHFHEAARIFLGPGEPGDPRVSGPGQQVFQVVSFLRHRCL